MLHLSAGEGRIGIGFVYARSRSLPELRSIAWRPAPWFGKSIELNYSLQVTPYFLVQPAFQYYANVGGNPLCRTPRFRFRDQGHILIQGVMKSRAEELKNISGQQFDLCVIGGGPPVRLAHWMRGCGDSNGDPEAGDFASATSVRTKIIHGGVRYLEKRSRAIFRVPRPGARSARTRSDAGKRTPTLRGNWSSWCPATTGSTWPLDVV